MNNEDDTVSFFTIVFYVLLFSIAFFGLLAVVANNLHNKQIESTAKTTVHFEKYGDIVFNGIPIIHSKGSCISGFLNDKEITICNDIFYVKGKSK